MQRQTFYVYCGVFSILLVLAFLAFVTEPSTDQRDSGTSIIASDRPPSQAQEITSLGAVGGSPNSSTIDRGFDLDKASDDEVCKVIADQLTNTESNTQSSASNENLKRLLDTKKSDQNPIARGSALFILAQQTYYSVSDQSHDQCGNDAQCHEQAESLADKAAANYFNELAKIALRSNDPRLYEMAFRGCQRVENNGDATCAQITAEQWALRDPTNGTTWLYVLEEYKSKDYAVSIDRVNSALFHLSQAKKFNSGLSSINEFSRSIGVQSEDLLTQYRLLELTNAALARSKKPSFNTASDLCNADLLDSYDRKAICNSIAEALINRSNSEGGLRVAEKLGQQLAWSGERLKEIHNQTLTLQKLRQDCANIEANIGSSIQNKHQSCIQRIKKARATNQRLVFS